MGSKSKWIGLIILLAVIGAAAVYLLLGGGPQPEPAVLRGYVGGEKIGLLEDEAVQDILERNYGLTLDYAKAGSLDMVTADHEGRNFLFPSSQTALEYYQQLCGAPDKSQIVFNTPIVLYTHRPILEAFQKKGLVTERDGVYYMDMATLVAEIKAGTAWADLGLPELYGTVAVNTTDPVRSNSGNMFAGLLANVLCGGVADADSVEAVLPRLKAIFEKLGYMEASSSDLFDQFLKTGMGAKPVIAGYENQLLEFAVENPEDWAQLKDDIVLIYPTPTVWSSHIFIALDEAGEAGIDALLDEEVQRLAWENHGFRTEVSGTDADENHFGVPHLDPGGRHAQLRRHGEDHRRAVVNVNFTAGLDKCAVQREAFSQMDGLIVYGSKYGTTRRYAEELSRLTGLPAIPCGEFHRLAEGSILVYLGALYAGGVLGLKQAMKGLSLGDGQRLIVATVGLADPQIPQNRAHILASLKRQMSPELFSQAVFFHLRGGIDYAVLSPRHRAMMAAMCFSLRRKPARQRSCEDQALLETYGKQMDFTDLSALAPIAGEILRG